MKSAEEWAVEVFGPVVSEKAVGLIQARDRENQATALRRAAQAVDGMVVGGRAWNQDQENAAKVLADVSKGLREMADRAGIGA